MLVIESVNGYLELTIL